MTRRGEGLRDAHGHLQQSLHNLLLLLVVVVAAAAAVAVAAVVVAAVAAVVAAEVDDLASFVGLLCTTLKGKGLDSLKICRMPSDSRSSAPSCPKIPLVQDTACLIQEWTDSRKNQADGQVLQAVGHVLGACSGEARKPRKAERHRDVAAVLLRWASIP